MINGLIADSLAQKKYTAECEIRGLRWLDKGFKEKTLEMLGNTQDPDRVDQLLKTARDVAERNQKQASVDFVSRR